MTKKTRGAAALFTLFIGCLYVSIPLLLAAALNTYVDVPTLLVWVSWIVAGLYAGWYLIATLFALAVILFADTTAPARRRFNR